MQTDPIFYADQMNMYAYVGNDPLNRIDPTGLTWEDFQAGASAGMTYQFTGELVQPPNNASGWTGHLVGGFIAVAATTPTRAGPSRGGVNPPKMVGETSRSKYAVARSSSAQTKFRKELIADNKAKNDGKINCNRCGKDLRENTGKIEKGGRVPDDQAQAHHKDGNRENNDAKTNGELLCPPCHRDEHKK